MPRLPLHAYIERNNKVTACCCQSDGTLNAISNATVSMVSESPAKTSRTLYKEQKKFREAR